MQWVTTGLHNAAEFVTLFENLDKAVKLKVFYWTSYWLSCSHVLRTKASMVAKLVGIFYQIKNDENVSYQVSSHGQLFRPY